MGGKEGKAVGYSVGKQWIHIRAFGLAQCYHTRTCLRGRPLTLAGETSTLSSPRRAYFSLYEGFLFNPDICLS